MTTEARTGAIDAPPDRVWDVLADYGAIASWAPNVDHSCLLTERADGVGAVRRIQTGRTTLREEVEAWEPGASLSYRIIGLPPIVRSATNTWRLTGSGGSTTVTLTSEVDCGPRPPDSPNDASSPRTGRPDPRETSDEPGAHRPSAAARRGRHHD